MYITQKSVPFAIRQKGEKVISIVLFRAMSKDLITFDKTDSNFNQTTIYLELSDFIKNYEFSVDCINWLPCGEITNA